MFVYCIISESGIIEDEKVLRRMNNQIHNTEMMMNQMLDEHTKVQIFNSAIRDKLQEEKERISQIEDALRVRIMILILVSERVNNCKDRPVQPIHKIGPKLQVVQGS